MEPATRARRLVGRNGRALAHHPPPPKHPIYSPLDLPAGTTGTQLHRPSARPCHCAGQSQGGSSQDLARPQLHDAPSPQTRKGRRPRPGYRPFDSKRRRATRREVSGGTGSAASLLVSKGDRRYTYGYWPHTWLLAGEPCSAHSRCHSRPWSSHLALSKNQRTAARGGGGGGGARAGEWVAARAVVHPVRLADYSEGT